MRHIKHSREADRPVGMHEMGHYSTVCQNQNRHVTTFFLKNNDNKRNKMMLSLNEENVDIHHIRRLVS